MTSCEDEKQNCFREAVMAKKVFTALYMFVPKISLYFLRAMGAIVAFFTYLNFGLSFPVY